MTLVGLGEHPAGAYAAHPLQAFGAKSGDGAKVLAGMTRAVPMRRLAQPADIAAAVAFFASDATGDITGQTLSVSGGLTMA